MHTNDHATKYIFPLACVQIIYMDFFSVSCSAFSKIRSFFLESLYVSFTLVSYDQ